MSGILDEARYQAENAEGVLPRQRWKDAADEISRLRELLIETRAQIGMQVCGACIHGMYFWPFLVYMSEELGLDPNRLCEPGYPKWEPDAEKASEQFVAHGISELKKQRCEG